MSEYEGQEVYKGKRFKLSGIMNRDQYIIVDEDGIMITFPNNKIKNWNYMATATALTRVISVALQAGVDVEGLKKQLKESTMQKGDTPDVLLTAIKKYQKYSNPWI